MTTDASSPRVHLLRTIAADLHRRIDDADRILRASLTVEDRARDARIGLVITDLAVARLSVEALEIELARQPRPMTPPPEQDRTPTLGLGMR